MGGSIAHILGFCQIYRFHQELVLFCAGGCEWCLPNLQIKCRPHRSAFSTNHECLPAPGRSGEISRSDTAVGPTFQTLPRNVSAPASRFIHHDSVTNTFNPPSTEPAGIMSTQSDKSITRRELHRLCERCNSIFSSSAVLKGLSQEGGKRHFPI